MNDISALLSGAFHIELEFTCESDALANLRVTDASVSEALCETYRAEISLMTEDAVDPPAMLGRNATFVVRRGGSERKLHGIVTRVEQGGVASVGTTSAMVLRVTVEPALCALKHTRDSRIFPNMTVIEIVNEVLGKGLLHYGRGLDTAKLKVEDYPKREYTVQYEESDYDFISRLLAQEGITYFFSHAEKVEKIFFADDNADFVKFVSVDGQSVPMTQRADENADTEPVVSFVRADRMGTTSVVVRDYDWTNPEPPGPKAELLAQDAQTRERTVYASTGETNIGMYELPPKKAYTEHDIGKRAERLRQRLVSHAQAFTGEGMVTGFMPGVVFELTDHALPDLDGKYVITSVVHTAGTGAAREGENADRYRNYFTCIPFETPYRPPNVTPWPRIHSVQTATVTGPSGAEMHTDEHGRIHVQFHWDRLGKRDDHSSCFIRVAQATAGPHYGFVFIPRIGMEVLVSFVEGNPDRPLVTGCVYNGKNQPFYELDKNQTRSVIRTRTFGTDAASGTKYNELSFNDAPDNEEIFTHASRNYREEVENDHNTTVMKNQSNTVKVNHSESVGGDQSLSVTGNRTHSVTGTEDLTITKARTVTVKDTETRTIEKALTENYNNTRTTTVKLDDTETISEGNKKVTVTAGTTDIISKGAFKVAQNATSTFELAGKFSLATPGTMNMSNEKTTFTGDDAGVITLNATSDVKILCSGSTITLAKDGTIKISGKNVTLAGTDLIELGVGSSVIKVEKAGVSVSGPKISSASIGMHEINGAVIKIG
jgi:type VI secretion system secreted protein VgrG